MSKYIDSEALMNSMNDYIDGMNRSDREIHANELWEKMCEAVKGAEEVSIVGIVQDASGFRFIAKGDAARGQEIGLRFGKAMMYEAVELELLRAGLLNEKVKSVLHGVKPVVDNFVFCDECMYHESCHRAKFVPKGDYGFCRWSAPTNEVRSE